MGDSGRGATRARHPKPARLTAFLQGRLVGAEAAEVERHLADCDACCRALLAAPEDDPLVLLLRRPRTAEGAMP